MFSIVHPPFVDILVYMRSDTPYLRKKSLLTLLPMQQSFMACNELKLGFGGNLIWIPLYLHIIVKVAPIYPSYSTILSPSFPIIKKINPLQTENLRMAKQTSKKIIKEMQTPHQLSGNFTGYLSFFFKTSLKIMQGEQIEIKMSDAFSTCSVRSPFSD